MFDHEIKETNRLLAAIEQQLRVQTYLLKQYFKMENKMATTLSDLLTKVSAVDDAATAFKTLDDGLKAQITTLTTELTAAQNAQSPDQVTIDAISAKLDIANATLAGASAVVVGTPVADAVAAIPGATPVVAPVAAS